MLLLLGGRSRTTCSTPNTHCHDSPSTKYRMCCPKHRRGLHDNDHRTKSSGQPSGSHPISYNWNQSIISAEGAVNESVMSQWEDELDGTILQIFQLIPEGSPRLYYQAKELEVICPPHTLQELHEGVIDLSCQVIAWLDDRSRSGALREGGGWLTRANLYTALRAKVCRNRSTNETFTLQHNTELRLTFIQRLQIDAEGEGDLPSADRRLL